MGVYPRTKTSLGFWRLAVKSTSRGRLIISNGGRDFPNGFGVLLPFTSELPISSRMCQALFSSFHNCLALCKQECLPARVTSGGRDLRLGVECRRGENRAFLVPPRSGVNSVQDVVHLGLVFTWLISNNSATGMWLSQLFTRSYM